MVSPDVAPILFLALCFGQFPSPGCCGTRDTSATSRWTCATTRPPRWKIQALSARRTGPPASGTALRFGIAGRLRLLPPPQARFSAYRAGAELLPLPVRRGGRVRRDLLQGTGKRNENRKPDFQPLPAQLFTEYSHLHTSDAAAQFPPPLPAGCLSRSRLRLLERRVVDFQRGGRVVAQVQRLVALVVAAASPVRGLKRAAARRALEVTNSGYGNHGANVTKNCPRSSGIPCRRAVGACRSSPVRPRRTPSCLPIAQTPA